ncbi:hypothetical protein QYF36_024196 [Acer negundo]|nr:hypothetical protein QYF36_024196 [Acer negundo]
MDCEQRCKAGVPGLHPYIIVVDSSFLGIDSSQPCPQAVIPHNLLLGICLHGPKKNTKQNDYGLDFGDEHWFGRMGWVLIRNAR